MIVLAIDTTGLAASAALVTVGGVLGELFMSYKQTHSETLMPMVDMLFGTVGLSPGEVDYIACTSGPGSFTGLRIGAATAKGLAAGLEKKIVPVPTLDSLAYNIVETQRLIVPIMDARRGQVYAAIYRCNGGRQERLTDYLAEDINALLERVAALGGEAVFLGDGVPVHRTLLDADSAFSVVPPHVITQRASAAGALALNRLSEAVRPDAFAPFYIRASQAEREYARKRGLKG